MYLCVRDIDFSLYNFFQLDFRQYGIVLFILAV